MTDKDLKILELLKALQDSTRKPWSLKSVYRFARVRGGKQFVLIGYSGDTLCDPMEYDDFIKYLEKKIDSNKRKKTLWKLDIN